AWSFGRGLPGRDVWPALASALDGGRRYTDDDVTRALHTYGRYIIESGEDDQAVYRLFHQELADHLAGDPRRRQQLDLQAGRLLSAQTANGRHPGAADPYLRHNVHHHLARAGQAGTDLLRTLVVTNRAAYLPDLSAALHERAARLDAPGQLEDALELQWES